MKQFLGFKSRLQNFDRTDICRLGKKATFIPEDLHLSDSSAGSSLRLSAGKGWGGCS